LEPSDKKQCLKAVEIYFQFKVGTSDEDICKEVIDLGKTIYLAIGGCDIGGGGYLAYT